MSSALESLQSAIVRQLREPMTHLGATVIARRAADLESQLETAIQAALGLSIIVLDPLPRRVEPAAPGPVFAEILITVRVIENLLINEHGTGILAAAEHASAALHLWPLSAPWAGQVLRLAENNPWTNPAGPLRGAVALDLHFLAASATTPAHS
ncbi:MAG TPA: hypothetical protein VHC95_06320 [Opitutales bacterium]|nr:hypothetical protein [Opitutales bacterium]